MNLSIFASYVMNRVFPTPEIGLGHMYGQGVRCADISEGLLPTYPLHMQVEYFKDAGLKPECLITTLDIATKDAQTIRKNIALMKGYIDQLEKLGIPLIMPAPSVIYAQDQEAFDTMQETLTESLAILTEYAKGSGVTVCIENQSSATRADSSMHDIKKILDTVPDLGFVLDSGNFFCIGEDVLEAYELLKDRLVHAHFKDWEWNRFGRELRENMPRFGGTTIGAGLLPLHELVQRMKRDGYEGSVALEFNACPITEKMLDDSAEFLRESFSLSL